MDRLAKERGSTLASSVYEVLRAEILTGALAPGSKLNIRQLCDRFAIGISPTREALNRLSTERLVQQEDNRGFIVTPVSLKELDDLTEARSWANEIGLREAIRRGNDKWEEDLVVAFYRLKRIPRQVTSSTGTFTRSRDWDAAHRVFHHALIAGCGSRWHIEVCDRMFEAAERYRNLARFAEVTRSSDREEEHYAIMQAALDRDETTAIDLLNRHFTETSQLVREVIKNIW